MADVIDFYFTAVWLIAAVLGGLVVMTDPGCVVRALRALDRWLKGR